jgi:benzoyl-CoA reductase/2-hydroxyglutaryl-CoA dehydratase subunit BcrC/BadD/HgdB
VTDPDTLSACLSYFREAVALRLAERELVAFDGPVVGTCCNFVPEELVWAVGGRTIRLCGGDVQAEAAGEELLPRDVCPVVKATAALPKTEPHLWNRLDLLVIPATCDAKRKLADVLRHRKAVHVMDVPAVKDSDSSRRHWLGEVERLAERVEQVSGRRMTRAGLSRAVRLSRRRESLFRSLLSLRHAPGGVLLTGEQFQFVAGASFADEPGRYGDRLEALVAALEAKRRAGWSAMPPGAPRVLLAGAPLIYPNFKLLRVIQEAGAAVVADDSCAGAQRLHPHLAPRDGSLRELLRALAEKALLPSMCPCFTSSDDRTARIKELVRASHADGIIYHRLRTCVLFTVESEILRQELQPEGVPLLVLDTDYSVADTEQLRTRVAAFLEMLAATVARGRAPAPCR